MTERGIKDREGEWEEKGGWEKQRETPDIDSRFGAVSYTHLTLPTILRV